MSQVGTLLSLLRFSNWKMHILWTVCKQREKNANVPNLRAVLRIHLGLKTKLFFIITLHYRHLCSFTFQRKAAVGTVLLAQRVGATCLFGACVFTMFIANMRVYCAFIIVVSRRELICRVPERCRVCSHRRTLHRRRLRQPQRPDNNIFVTALSAVFLPQWCMCYSSWLCDSLVSVHRHAMRVAAVTAVVH